ncbi:MAG: response regulator transcription factor [Coriobacteriales bacterium]|nr:response regulator transcription factor [Coriobacteriales bacterium]
MTVQRILVVDDEDSILKVVDYALSQEGYEVHTAGDAPTAETMFAKLSPDLVILDVMLPGKSGLETARELRTHSSVPIVMLSARADEVDRILGLEFGADDYVTKPFSPRELVSRVKAILRRTNGHGDGKAKISVGDLHIDTLSRQVHMGDEAIHLTRTEFDILLHLARHPGKAFPREAILVSLWETSPVGDERAIDVHIHNIREKLEPDPKNPSYLLTVRGFGYHLREA